ncbi:MAG TPA: M1 family metallopeptidase, partial [Saprospiraceae bacterium]|nr:M1 family metallopeptidase [Saprospiraceae bacterium]
MPSKKEFYASPVLFRWLLPVLVLFFSSFIQSQFAWAQRPVYHIDVVLDTAAKTLSGKLIIAYTNPASYPLDSLAIHLWANAYQDKQSAFARQLLNLGNLFFNAAKPGQMGGYSGLNFTSTEQQLDFRFDAGGHDIGWIILSNPLPPGQTIHITTPFNLKIPISFSRMGRTGDSYQFTQWYPHLAVLDEEGWHTMPYLDQGEFFNDFADYHVTVNVPAGYVVAATGMIRDKENADDRAIWNFTAENVIDFAWFANPHFRVEEKKIELAQGKSFLLSVYIDTLHAGQWDQALSFSERALNFYSDWLGPYPYPHMSVVSAPFSKGGFMEYPMLAQIGATFSSTYLDIVITHEIGHTWLYGILADNERATPWMDEGLNTFFERKYTRTHYPAYDESVAPDFLRTSKSMPDDEALQHF